MLDRPATTGARTADLAGMRCSLRAGAVRVGATVAVAALVAGLPGPDAQARQRSAPDLFQATTLALTNAARAQARDCGGVAMAAAPPVRWNQRLALAAISHSADMAGSNYFSHDDQSGRNPFQRMRAAGYRYRAAGENIAAGEPLSSPEAVVAAWLASPSHCRVLMNPSFRDIGIGRVVGPGAYVIYWTQDFGLAK